MPINVTITLYTFDELSDKAKDRARNWWRRCSEGDNSFAEPAIEDATAIAKILGFAIDEDGVNWSGFSSQGDGASFTGSWERPGEQPIVNAIKAYAPIDERLHKIAEDLDALSVDAFTVRRIGHHYSHSCTVIAEVDDDSEIDDDARTITLGEASTAATHAARAFMDWIYRQLEAQYEYENSNEAIDENLCANEYTFRANGEREDAE